MAWSGLQTHGGTIAGRVEPDGVGGAEGDAAASDDLDVGRDHAGGSADEGTRGDSVGGSVGVARARGEIPSASATRPSRSSRSVTIPAASSFA